MKFSGARARHTLAAVAVSLAAASCGDVQRAEMRSLGEPVVYGDDDRREPFAHDEPEWLTRAVRTRLLALGDRAHVSGSPPALVDVPTLEERYGLCEGEAFAEQPSFALCTGVIVASRWVLTAAHCARALPLSELVGISGFYVESPGAVHHLAEADVRAFTRVASTDEYWDYAWLELATPVAESADVPFGTVENGDAIVSPQHGAGLPAKIARSHVAKSDGGAFWSTLDAFGGASGAPVFSPTGELAGVLTSGAADYDATPAGCFRASLRADVPEAATERAVRIEVALEGLCAVGDGGEACGTPAAEVAAGCSIGRKSARGASGATGASLAMFLALAWSGVFRRRLSARCRPSTAVPARRRGRRLPTLRPSSARNPR